MVGRLPVLLLAVVLAFVPPTLANHSQPAHGDAIVFDHKAGNEWWVEVVLTGGASGSVSAVQALDTGGAWTPLKKQSWGAWAASFHIEAGHQVRFRAQWSGGDQAESCWFDHPSGVERCGTTSTTSSSSSSSSSSTSSSSSSPTGGAFDATFSGVKGNNWWVEAKVSANQPLAGVDARVDCTGSWRPLALKDWGAWAASFNVPSGSKVDFRARSTSGATDLSGGYTWTTATPTSACPGGSSSSSSSTSTGPGGFDATFTGVKGNMWWIQASVGGNQPISKVEARLDCEPGAWFPLQYKGWGWATSIQVLDGQRVDLRATSTSGATDLSGGYTWPTAAAAPACPATWPPAPTGFHARYTDLAGDQDRVEATVTANKPLAAVHARTQNSVVWHALAPIGGGRWAADFDVTDHNVLEFRATATDGSLHVTDGGWFWPTDWEHSPTTPQPYPAPSSYQGSNVYWSNFRGDEHQVSVNTYSIYPLIKVELSIDLGEPWYPMTMDPSTGDWHASGLDIPYGSDVWFRATSVLATGRTAVDYEPGGEGPWPLFPQMGSYYSYREKGTSSGTDDETGVHYESTSDTYIHVETTTGSFLDWEGTCTTITTSFVTPPGQPGHWENRTDEYEFSPDWHPGGWVDAAVGESAYLDYPSTCALVVDDDIKVCSEGPHQTALRTSSGDPITLESKLACRSGPDGTQEFWYESRLGMLTDWRIVQEAGEFSDWQSETYGWLLDTNAPLTAP